MKTLDAQSSTGSTLYEIDDLVSVVNVVGVGTTFPRPGTQPSACASSTSARTVVVAHRTDDSNYAVGIGWGTAISGQVIELYTDGSGSVTVFYMDGQTFLDGTTSMVVTQGARFVFTNRGLVKMGS
jgi:hypothetical protein